MEIPGPAKETSLAMESSTDRAMAPAEQSACVTGDASTHDSLLRFLGEMRSYPVSVESLQPAFPEDPELAAPDQQRDNKGRNSTAITRAGADRQWRGGEFPGGRAWGDYPSSRC